jgi:hypothetical protein
MAKNKVNKQKTTKAKSVAVPKADPHKIFLLAESFTRALNLAGNQMLPPSPPGVTVGGLFDASDTESATMEMAPLLILDSFALELYFKCLICIETGTAPFTHNLLHLYQSLSQSTQIRLKKHYDTFAAEPLATMRRTIKNLDGSIEAALKASAEAFIVYRYVYEKTPLAGTGYFGGAVRWAAIVLILEMRPTWTRNQPSPVVRGS